MASLVVSIRGRELKTIPIEKPTITIGRDKSCDVTIDNIAVSRVHAKVLFDGKGFSLEDSGSSNGIFINGKRAEKLAKLHMGDEIMVLKHSVTLVASGGLDLSAASFTGVGDHTRHRYRKEGPRKPAANQPVQSTLMMSDGDVSKLMSNLEQARKQKEEGPEEVDDSGVSPVVAVSAVLLVLLSLALIAFFATS